MYAGDDTAKAPQRRTSAKAEHESTTMTKSIIQTTRKENCHEL